MSYRDNKLPELLKRLAADFFEREALTETLITITGSSLSKNQKRAVIFFTVLPDSGEKNALEFMNRKKRDFFEFVDSHARIGRMPEISFEIDKGEKNRQRIDFLLEN